MTNAITHVVDYDEEFYMYAPYGQAIGTSLTRVIQTESLQSDTVSLRDAYNGINHYGHYTPTYKPCDKVFLEVEGNVVPKVYEHHTKDISVLIEVNYRNNTYSYKNKEQDIDIELPLSKAKALAEELDKTAPDTYREYQAHFVKGFKRYQEEQQMRIVVVEPGEPAYEQYIEPTLKAKQKIVGGLIEPVYDYLDDSNLVIIGNDEARLMEMEPNRSFPEISDQLSLNTLCGTFFICALTEDNFKGLTKEQSAQLVEQFKEPHTYTEKEKQEALKCQSSFVEFRSAEEFFAFVESISTSKESQRTKQRSR